MAGFIKIYRDILDWEWWSDIKTYRVFTYMLLKANWTDGKFKGIDVPKGSFVTSLDKLAYETSLSVNEVRTAIKHLIKTDEITSESHGKFTIFTVKNYCQYQDDNKQNPDKAQTENKQNIDKEQENIKQITNKTQEDNKQNPDKAQTENKQNIDKEQENIKQITNKTQEDNKQNPDKAQTDNRQITTIEEYKKYNNKKNNITMCIADADALFDRVWILYPLKKGKGRVSDAAKKRIAAIGYDEMARAIERYKKYVDSVDYLHYQNGSTFFNSGYIDYLDANYSDTVANTPKHSSQKNNQFGQMIQQDYDIEQLEQMLEES